MHTPFERRPTTSTDTTDKHHQPANDLGGRHEHPRPHFRNRPTHGHHERQVR